MLLVNGSVDLTEYQTRRVPNNFRFAERPGSITYAAIESLSIFNPPDDSLNPVNPYSPFHSLQLNQPVTAQVGESNLVRQATITHVSNDGGELLLTLQDATQRVLEKNMVLASYIQYTPAELLKLVAESFGLQVDLAGFTTIKAQQEFDGLFFNLVVGVANQLTVQDLINQLCVAGFMRACLYNNRIWLIGGSVGPAATVVLPQEVHSIPTQNQQVTEIYNGGSITWVAGTVTETGDPSKPAAPLSLDYSNSSILRLNNPSGAYALIEYNTNPPIGRMFEMDIALEIVEPLSPGAALMLMNPILHPFLPVKGRLVGREAIDYNQHSRRCVIEVFYG
jgi:hypothetical protein